MTVADLMALIPILAAAYAVVLGVVAMVTGWQVFRHRKRRRAGRDAVVPPVGAIESVIEGDRS